MKKIMEHKKYIERCFQLARMGEGKVAPNPLVGAVLVYEDRIIGEGYHQQYGEAHAEVNALRSVKDADRPLVPSATMYVSLEPCAHHGKTPPCADLLIREGIKRVVISNRDPFPQVDGKGIDKLIKAGVEVITGIEEEAGRWVNRRFFTFHTAFRPYIVLKWAQTANGYMAGTKPEEKRWLISNALTNRLVHCWRSEESGILVGVNTVLKDNPALNNRLWQGNSPVRIVIDPDLVLDASPQVMDGSVRTLILNNREDKKQGLTSFIKMNKEKTVVQEVCRILWEENIQSVLVEGGAATLRAFMKEGLFDELRIITNTSMYAEEGLAAPHTGALRLQQKYNILHDEIHILTHPHNASSHNE